MVGGGGGGWWKSDAHCEGGAGEWAHTLVTLVKSDVGYYLVAGRG